MSNFLQMIDAGTLNLLAGLAVIVSFGLLILLILFGLLAFRGIFRWLTRGSWNDVVRSAERKAIR